MISSKIQPGTVYGNEEIVHLGKEIVVYDSYAKGKNLLRRNVFETQTKLRQKMFSELTLSQRFTYAVTDLVAKSPFQFIANCTLKL